jgi:hypothetical protein
LIAGAAVCRAVIGLLAFSLLVVAVRERERGGESFSFFERLVWPNQLPSASQGLRRCPDWRTIRVDKHRLD